MLVKQHGRASTHFKPIKTIVLTRYRKRDLAWGERGFEQFVDHFWVVVVAADVGGVNVMEVGVNELVQEFL